MPARTPAKARCMKPPSVIPDASVVEEASRPVSGLTSLDARLPALTARRGLVEHPHSLTVAGAVQSFHLFPEHPKGSQYHSRMRLAALLLGCVCAKLAFSQAVVRDDYGKEVRLAAPAAPTVRPPPPPPHPPY